MLDYFVDGLSDKAEERGRPDDVGDGTRRKTVF